jgi:RNA polymerase sigma-70 factor (ECF subfamily)
VRVHISNVREHLGSLAHAVDLDEIRQLLAMRLVLGDADHPPRIVEYSGRGALGGWVRIAAVRLALDVARQGARVLNETFDDALLQLTVDGGLERELVKNRYSQHFRDGFREALARTPAPERALLRLHYLEGMTTAAMAAAYRVSRPTIVRRIAEARAHVLESTAQVVKEALQLTTQSYDELLAVVRSELEITVEKLMTE